MEYQVLDGAERDEVIDRWREEQRRQSRLTVKEGLMRLLYIVSFTEPNGDPALLSSERSRAEAKHRAEMPIQEVRRYESADGTTRHKIVPIRHHSTSSGSYRGSVEGISRLIAIGMDCQDGLRPGTTMQRLTESIGPTDEAA